MSGVSRRVFLARTGSLAAGALATSAVPRYARAYPLGLPPGIQLYSVRSDIERDAPTALKQIAAIGYKEVEPAGFGSLQTASKFRKALDDNGVRKREICSLLPSQLPPPTKSSNCSELSGCRSLFPSGT